MNRSFWKTTLTFAVAGPPLGGLALIGWWISVQFSRTGSVDGTVFWLVLAGAFYGYMFGLLPAFLTGVLSSAISPSIRSWWVWAVTSGVIGWLASALVLSLAGFLTDDPAAKFWNGVIGAIPAVICAWISRKNRLLRFAPVQTATKA